MYTWNRTIQWLFIGILIFFSIVALTNNGNFRSIVIVTMLWLAPVGVSQLLASIIDVIDKGKKALLYRHLIISLLALFMFLLSSICFNWGFGIIGQACVFIGSVGSGLMLFYYWFLVFFGYKNQKHEMEIIQKLRKQTKK